MMAFTFGGQNILGTDHRGTRTVYSGAESVRQRFRLPGLVGEFEHVQSLGAGFVVVTSTLKAASADSLQTLLDGLDALKADNSQQTVTDGFGRNFANCVLDNYELLSPVLTLDGGAGVIQDVRLVFRKLF